MKRLIVLALTAALTLGGVAVATSAVAGGNDVTKTGTCSGSSEWKLKLKPDNGRIEVEFEVDQNVVGDAWKVRMKDNGDVFFHGRRTAQGPSGSFSVTRFVNDASGTDRVVAKATNLSTDEVCKGVAEI
jgi:hypothetical protein